jgi:hypothetical protein
MAQLGSLGREMAGDLNIKPILNLGSQMKDFDSHNGIPLQFRGPPEPASKPKCRQFKALKPQRHDAYSMSR